MINKAAISHQPVGKDCFALSETSYHLRLWAEKNNLKKCYLLYADRMSNSMPLNFKKREMKIEYSSSSSDVFGLTITDGFPRLDYCFELVSEDEKLYFLNGFFENSIEPLRLKGSIIDNREEFFTFPYARREEILKEPEWWRNAFVYNIFPDSFANAKGAIVEGKEKKEKWGDVPLYSRLGGTIRGITDNLEYISSMGFNVLYLNPIFVAQSYHKYDTVDYLHVDPCFGQDKDLKELVEKAHKMGIRVILDAVFNHCGWNFFAFQDLRKNGLKSKYVNWFYDVHFPLFDENGNPRYTCFAYEKTMVKMNTSNKAVMNYFGNVGVHWIKNYGIDGWRLDVCNEIDKDFWRYFRKRIREANPEAILLGEIWENAEGWLQGDLLDSSMNYDFMKAARQYIALGTITLDAFYEKAIELVTRYPTPIIDGQLNLLDSHDVPRFFSFAGENEQKYRSALAFLFLFPGVPSLFYGDEKNMQGVKENEYRHPMEWSTPSYQKDLIQKLISIKTEIRKEKALFSLIPYEKSGGLFGMLYSTNSKEWVIFFNKSGKDLPIPKPWASSTVNLFSPNKKTIIKNDDFVVLIRKR